MSHLNGSSAPSAANDPTVPLLSDDLEDASRPVAASHGDIMRQWVLLGWTAFGGPSAHIGVFRKVFVERLRWLHAESFMELLALGSCLPGPTSTQMSFAIGIMKQGWTGGLLSGALFQYPGALMLTLVGVGAATFLEDPHPWLRGAIAGLAAVGVSLVVSAALALTRGICTKADQQLITTAAAAVAFYYQSAWIFPTLILLGGFITCFSRKREETLSDTRDHNVVDSSPLARTVGLCLIAVWAVVLVGATVGVALIPYEDAKPLHWFEGFYRTGSFIFGGGQVLLPMLLNVVFDPACQEAGATANTMLLAAGDFSGSHGGGGELCGSSWLTKEEFYTGLAVSQAMPGPLFNFAAYLGAVIASHAGVWSVWGAALAWLGIFAPGVMMMFAVLPWWGVFRKWPLYRRALPGLNAAAVGLLVAAAFQLTFQARQTSAAPTASICIGMVGWGLTEVLKVPAPLAILTGGALGVCAWFLGLH